MLPSPIGRDPTPAKPLDSLLAASLRQSTNHRQIGKLFAIIAAPSPHQVQTTIAITIIAITLTNHTTHKPNIPAQ